MPRSWLEIKKRILNRSTNSSDSLRISPTDGEAGRSVSAGGSGKDSMYSSSIFPDSATSLAQADTFYCADMDPNRTYYWAIAKEQFYSQMYDPYPTGVYKTHQEWIDNEAIPNNPAGWELINQTFDSLEGLLRQINLTDRITRMFLFNPPLVVKLADHPTPDTNPDEAKFESIIERNVIFLRRVLFPLRDGLGISVDALEDPSWHDVHQTPLEYKTWWLAVLKYRLITNTEKTPFVITPETNTDPWRGVAWIFHSLLDKNRVWDFTGTNMAYDCEQLLLVFGAMIAVYRVLPDA